jgi:hypothetical protein
METEVVVALVSSLTSLAVAAGTAVAQRASGKELEQLKFRLQQEAREEERRAQEAVQLARFREPLLDAAEDLRHRLHNIRKDGFLAYLGAAP